MKSNIMMMMTRVFTCAIFLVLCHSSSGSRAYFKATPGNIYPVLTQTLQLRCAVQHNVRIVKRQVTQTATTLRTTHPATVATAGLASTTATTPIKVSTAATTIYTTSSTHSTTKSPIFTQVEVSHIVSIIVSRTDRNTGLQRKVASLSSFDPPTAFTDLDKITVNGHSNSSPIAGELGYLEITWTFPVSDQSGPYTCEINALDANLHPVSTSEVVYITASEPTTSELASIIAQSNKHITELIQTVSELRNQTAHLQSQSDQNALTLNHLTGSMHGNQTLVQNIQTGPINCMINQYVPFQRPYNSQPTVFVALSGLSLSFSTGSANITVQKVSPTGFIYYCSLSQITPTAYWIAIGN